MLKTKKGISIIKKFIKTHTRSKNTSCKVNNSFMLKFVLLKPSFISINCNDEINNHSFQTISNSCLISLAKAYIFN